MATIFFHDVFGNETAPRVMSGVIALSIFGNIVVMTFTASKGKATLFHPNATFTEASNTCSKARNRQGGYLAMVTFFCSKYHDTVRLAEPEILAIPEPGP